MSRAQNSGTSTPSTSNNAPQPKANLSHPCFDCGLMFANKDDYQHHETIFHNVREKTTFMLCDECGKTFESPDDLGEHQLEHDLSILVRALYESEAAAAINRAQFATTPKTKIKKGKKESTASQFVPFTDIKYSDTLLKQTADFRPTVDVVRKPTKKYKKHKQLETSDAPFELRAEGSSPKKAKKQIKQKISQSSIDAPKNRPNLLSFNDRATSTESPSQIVSPPILPTSNPNTYAATSPTNQTSSSRPSLAIGPPSQPVPGGVTAAPVMLSSICPNCNENHGKPWSLIEHMISKHGALLVRLEKKFTTLANHSVSEFFTHLRCQYCGMESDQLPSCLSHIVKTHREKLFECTTCGECEVCFELMSSFGTETTKRKFTIRVKIKRRAK